MRRGVLIAILALAAIFAVTAPARANLTAGPADVTGYPESMTDVNGAQSALCLDRDAASHAACPGQPTPSDMLTDGEAFYWTGAVDVEVPGGTVSISFDVEAATAPDGLGGTTKITFQRIQMGGKDSTLPAGTYTFVTPFGNFTATRNTTRPNNWNRIQSGGAEVGPIDHFLTSTSAPAGFYGDGATANTTQDGAIVSVYLPGHNPADVDPVTLVPLPADGVSDQWTIMGALVGTPITLPPADTDKDGVPDSSDNCPTVAGPASNSGCPLPKPVVTPPATQQQQPQVITNTITQVVPAPTIGSATVVTRQAFNGRVTALTLRNGVANMRTPRGADVVRLTVRKGGKFVKRITRTVNDNGQRLRVVLTRKPGRYSVEVRAGNEQNDVTTFGPTVRRSFRVV